MKDGLIKAAAASPVLRVADAEYNAGRVIACIRDADRQGVKVLVFPELTLTGCSCRDLFRHSVLLNGAASALGTVAQATAGLDVLSFVGLPLAVGAQVYSVAAVVYDGDVLAFVPREQVNDSRFAAPGSGMPACVDCSAFLPASEGKDSFRPLVCGALFPHRLVPELRVAVEVGAGLQRFGSPAEALAANGATLLAQMASFPQTVSSREEAELNARYESRQLAAGILLAAPGKGESTTDRAYSGLCLAAENGVILASEEGADSMAVTEIDVQHMVHLRRADGGFVGAVSPAFPWGKKVTVTRLTRQYARHPHLPADAADLPAYCWRMLDIQVSGLVKRMEYAGLDHCVVGISGGVDSTLCVLVSAMAVKRMGLPSTNVVACTMPCFGTSSRTKSNAIIVAEQLGADVRVIDISKSVSQHFADIGHASDDYSVVFENAQARERTQVLMDLANKTNGLDVGTEDLSEFIDGWCTYNGDHTSMYDVNIGMTKTQVRAAVRYIADSTEDRVLKAALYDVLDCPVTPELLPIHDDRIEQKSEDSVGSYSLQDFFTHKMLICGFTPSKTFRLAQQAYAGQFTDEELLRWLDSYCRRLFSQQFKRSCLMDGPAVEAFSVSPRDGFLIPSDAENTLFLRDLEQLAH